MLININIAICALTSVYEVNQTDICSVNLKGHSVSYKVNGHILVVSKIVYENLSVYVKKMNERMIHLHIPLSSILVSLL